DGSLIGPLAAGVPGSPAGLFELHRRLGKLPWRAVVAPALRLARAGFVVPRRLEEAITAERKLLVGFPETAAVWLPGGQPPAAGSLMRLPKLADALAAYASEGPAGLTGGELARAVEASSRAHGGMLTARDLAQYRPEWRAPVRFAAFGWEVAAMPLPSSGGIILAQSARMLETLGWASLPRGGAQRAHLLAEVWRRAFADRYLLGDPGSALAGPRELLDPSWLARRAAEIDPGKASSSRAVASWPGAPAAEKPETTHLSVVDGAGNAVAVTTTLNGRFGCGLLVGAAGYLLNNEMDDFATARGRPNLWGLIQGEANAVAPGKRPLSSMSPTIAWRGAELVALGSPGGSHIPTATLQVLLNLILDGDSLQAAIDRPRLHHQWLPDELIGEADARSPETDAELRRRGHTTRQVRNLGEVHAVRASGGVVEAAADPRGPGAAGVVSPAPG
ncbi:MAG: gamma-glutamyltransferase family protein, partial [Acidobacteriota bacterium]